MKFVILIVRNVRRNLLRTGLTFFATVLLVLVVTLVWSILSFINDALTSRKQDIKAIVTERWQIPSQMPRSYVPVLATGAKRDKPGEITPTDWMSWQFYGGTTDPVNRTFDNTVFAFAMQPDKLNTMMDDLDTLPDGPKQEFAALVARMRQQKNALILGKDRLARLKRNVGDRITLFGTNYKDINLEFEIIGVFPIARYALSGAFDCDYLNNELYKYERTNRRKHPLADKTVNLIWLRVNNSEEFDQLSQQIADSTDLKDPAVKCEVSSAAIATFLAGYRDIFWGMRWLLGPAALLSLSLITANAISISVRERQQELAVMKVLGFRPWMILALVLGESLLLGAASGFISSAGTYLFVNWYLGGIDFPIGFFPKFDVPVAALWWGPAVGGAAALLGSASPPRNASTVKVTDVFSKVA